jgi:hypothetical protein
MATNVQTGALLKATWDSDVEIVDTTSGSDPGFDLAAGTYMGFAFLAEEFTVAVADAFTVGQWSVAGNSTEGELIFTITTLPDRNGGKIYEFEYSVNSGSDWANLPAGTTTGVYTATGVTGGTYTTSVMLRMVTSAGNGGNSDAKTATVQGAVANEITNGGFDDGTAWGFTGANVSITGGKLVFADATAGTRANQTFANAPLSAGNYDWSFDVTNGNGEDLKLIFRDASSQIAATADIEMTNGTKSNTITIGAPITSIRAQVTGANLSAEIDHLSVTAA